MKEYLLSNGEVVQKKPQFQSRNLHIRPIFHFTKDDKAQQQFKAECDINNIMRRFEKTGQLPDLIKSNPQYGDFSSVPEFLEAQNIINMAETQFAALSSKIRARFDNDPAQFLEFASNPANAAEMVSLGLATKPAPTLETPPQKVIVVTPEPPKTT